MPPEHIVSYAIQERCQGSWNYLKDNIKSKSKVALVLREPLPQNVFDLGDRVRGHGEQHLQAMKGQRVFGFLYISTHSSGNEHYFDIEVKNSDQNHHKEDPISNVPLSEQ